MPTPSLYPILMKAVASGIIVAEGTEFIETFGLETTLDVVDLELVELGMDVEVLDVLDVEIVDTDVTVDVVCTDFRAADTNAFSKSGFSTGFK